MTLQTDAIRDPIEDLVNLGLTYWVKVDDTSNWPVQAFTMRFTPIPAAATTPDEICDDSIDNDGDGAIDCDDSECAEVEDICWAQVAYGVPFEVCDDGVDNDWDGDNLPEGTYFYVLKCYGNTGEDVFRGAVTILK